jgi:ABC-type antimicrobial peptide transport system permease subunit
MRRALPMLMIAVTFVGVAALVLAVGLAACAGPALGAARVDPLVAMRAE